VVEAGDTFTLETSVSSSVNYMVKWYRKAGNGSYVELSGENSTSLNRSESVSGSYFYKIIVWSACGTETESRSVEFTVTVLDVCPPVTSVNIVGSATRTAEAGVPFTLEVNVAGSANYAVKWYRRAGSGSYAELTGYNLPSLTYTEQSAGTYTYRATAWNPACGVESAGKSVEITVTVSVACPPVTSVNVGGSTVRTAEAGVPFTLDVTVAGSASYTLKWYRRAGSGSYVELTGYNLPSLTYTEQSAGVYGYKAVAWNPSCDSEQTGRSVEITVTVTAVCPPVTSVNIAGSSTRTAEAGVPFTLNVTVAGSANYTVKWYRRQAAGNYAELSGYNLTSLTYTEQNSGTYTYKAVAWNPSCGGEATAKSVEITVTIAAACPPVTSAGIVGAATRTAEVNTPFTLEVTVAGSANYTVKWYRKAANGSYVELSGYNLASLTYSEQTAGTYTYKAVAWNPSCGAEATGASVEITVVVTSACPSVTSVNIAGAASRTAEAGVPFTLDVSVTGSANYTVKWYRRTGNGSYSELSGYNLTSLTYSEQSVGTYAYKAVAWNPACGSESEGRSVEIVVTIVAACPPVTAVAVVGQTSIVAEAGVPFTLEVSVAGSANYVLKWYRRAGSGNFTELSGYNLSSLTYSEQTAGTYTYKAVAWNPSCGEEAAARSAEITVTVSAACPPVTSVAVAGQTSVVAEAGVPFTLEVSVTGSANYSLKWYRRAGSGSYVELQGYTLTSITRTEQSAGTYTYKAAAWNPACGEESTAKSVEIVVTVTDACPPVVAVNVVGSAARVAEAGVPFTLDVTVAGSSNYVVKWYRRVGNGGFAELSGYSLTSLTYAEQTAGTYTYRAVVWNPACGSEPAAKSVEITVTVNEGCPPVSALTVVGTGTRVAEVGVPFTLEVSVLGSANYIIRWYRREGSGSYAELQGYNQTSVTRAEQSAGTYTYRAVAWNPVCESEATGKSIEIVMTITVGCPPVTSVNIVGSNTRVAEAGVPFTLETTVSGSANYVVKWYRRTGNGNFAELSGYNSTSLTYSEQTAGVYTYKVSAWNPACDAESGAKNVEITVTVNEACPPVSAVTISGATTRTVEVGVPFTLEVTVAGSANYLVKWYRKEAGGSYVELPGYNLAIFVYTEQTAGTYTYKAVAWNASCGSESAGKSVEIVVTVNHACPPVTSVAIVGSTSRTAEAGIPFTLEATVAGSTNYMIKWYRRDAGGSYAELTGYNLATFIYTEQTAGVYTYKAIAWNPSCGAEATGKSVEITVTVNEPCRPVASLSVTGSTSRTAETGVPFTLEVTVAGTSTYTVKWYRREGSGNFVEMQGYNQPSVTYTEQIAGTYTYRSVAWNHGCEAESAGKSAEITVTVNNSCPPVASISLVGSTSLTVEAGTPFTIEVTVAGSANYTLKWYRRAGSGSFVEMQGYNLTTLIYSESVGGTYTYRAVAWNPSCGMETTGKSVEVPVTVNEPCIPVGSLSIVGSASRTVEAGTPFTLEVTVAGTSTYTLKWYRREGSGNFAELTGYSQTSIIRNEQTAGTYTYRAVAWNHTCESESTAKNTDITVTVNHPCISVNSVTVVGSSSRTVEAGTPFTLEVTVAGPSGYTVKWYRRESSGNFAELTGYSQTSITRTESTAGTYTYRAVAWNHTCESESTAKNTDITVTVNHPCISINSVTVVGSSSRTVEAGTPFTLEVTVAGPASYTVKWYRRESSGNFIELTGYSQTSITRTEQTAGTYTYRAVAWNHSCESESAAKSTDITVTVNSPCVPVSSVTVVGSASRTVEAGTPFTLEVTVAGPASYTLKWYRRESSGNFTELTGYTQTSITRTESIAGTYTYRAIAWNHTCESESAAKSVEITVTVNPPCIPVSSITVTGSASRTVEAGETFTLQVTVAGTSGYTVKWYRRESFGNFTELTGYSQTSITRTEQTAGTYTYRAIAWNHTCESESAAKSVEITVTVNPPCIPVSTITVTGSASRTVEAGTPFTLEVTVAGPASYTVKWYRRESSGNFTELTGYSQTSITRSESTAGTYTYRAIAWNHTCESESAAKSVEITVTVNNPCQPVTGVTLTSTYLPGEKTGIPFTLAANVTGNTDYTVRWERSADNGNTYQPIPGATTIVYSHVEQTAGTYLYRAVVAARCGGGEATSASMVVIVGTACEPAAVPTLSGSSTMPNEKVNIAFTLQASIYGGNPDYSVQWVRAKISGDNQCPGSPGSGSGTATFADISGATSLVFSRTETTPGVYQYKATVWPRCGSRTQDGKETGVITVTVSCTTAGCPGYLAPGGEYRQNHFGYLIAGSIIPFDDFRTFTFAALTSEIHMGNQPYFTPTGRDLCFYKKDAVETGSYIDLKWATSMAACADPNALTYHDGTVGWRLPNIAELGKLYMVDKNNRTFHLEPTSAPGTESFRVGSFYWSSTQTSVEMTYTWGDNRPAAFSMPIGNNSWVRCVKPM
jgi:hypothetical protein